MRAVKPLLSGLIDSVEAYCSKTGHDPVNYNIEIKPLDSSDFVYHFAPKEYAELVMKVINDKKIADRVIIQSFDKRSLKVIRQEYPTISISYLVDFGSKIPDRDFEKELGFKPEIISPNFLLVNRSIINILHDENIRLIPWTVNNIETAQKLYRMGIDGIITDYPDIIINANSVKPKQ